MDSGSIWGGNMGLDGEGGLQERYLRWVLRMEWGYDKREIGEGEVER